MVHCFNSILITVGIAGNSMILPTDCLAKNSILLQGKSSCTHFPQMFHRREYVKKHYIPPQYCFGYEYRFRGKIFVHNFNAQGIILYRETMGQTELLVKLQFDMEQFSDVMYPCYHIARRKMAISTHNGFGVVSYRCTSKPFFDALSR